MYEYLEVTIDESINKIIGINKLMHTNFFFFSKATCLFVLIQTKKDDFVPNVGCLFGTLLHDPVPLLLTVCINMRRNKLIYF